MSLVTAPVAAALPPLAETASTATASGGGVPLWVWLVGGLLVMYLVIALLALAVHAIARRTGWRTPASGAGWGKSGGGAGGGWWDAGAGDFDLGDFGDFGGD